MKDAGKDMKTMKKNNEILNKSYKNISYTMSEIKVNIDGNSAVSSDKFIYSATPAVKGYKPIKKEGTERIYWKREEGTWKIVNWIYE